MLSLFGRHPGADATSALVAEALGMQLPGSAAIPAPFDVRGARAIYELRAFYRAIPTLNFARVAMRILF